MENNDIQDELTTIRNLMERSAKFISLSGLSGILAGVYAIIGAALAYKIVYSSTGLFSYRDYTSANLHTNLTPLIYLIIIASAVLIAAVGTGFYLSKQKAQKTGQPIWGKTSQALVYNMAIPLVTGGIFILILITRGYYGIIASSSLIFYGIALICGSHFTFTDVKYLGFFEIALGLTAAMLPGYGLIFWVLGFGVLHIVYGSIMYFKYDK